jgi:hypothetical protein
MRYFLVWLLILTFAGKIGGPTAVGVVLTLTVATFVAGILFLAGIVHEEIEKEHMSG